MIVGGDRETLRMPSDSDLIKHALLAFAFLSPAQTQTFFMHELNLH